MGKNLTTHKIINNSSQNMKEIKNESIDLIVTSPPYPMIEMWDELFFELNPEIKNNLILGNCENVFDLMHNELNKVWSECIRVVKPGGFICVNIGDATRTVNENFKLYPNHSKIIEIFLKNNMDLLPIIHWKKTTNSPNKFMGSGMLPAGAYVTLENEYILIFRKFGKRVFKSDFEKSLRRESAYFWEERNEWFSDMWNFTGVPQNLNYPFAYVKTRKRSAAYPFELPKRLINMFSVIGDTVLDPFLGTGTTTFASMAFQRNSIGYEIDKDYYNYIVEKIPYLRNDLNKIIFDRYNNHKQFISLREDSEKVIKYYNENLKTKVITNQETSIKLFLVNEIIKNNNDNFEIYYKDFEYQDILKTNSTSIKLFK